MIRTLLGKIRKRRRLEIHSVIDHGDSRLIRYEDPETGTYYVGLFRYDPGMIESVLNRFE